MRAKIEHLKLLESSLFLIFILREGHVFDTKMAPTLLHKYVLTFYKYSTTNTETRVNYFRFLSNNNFFFQIEKVGSKNQYL